MQQERQEKLIAAGSRLASEEENPGRNSNIGLLNSKQESPITNAAVSSSFGKAAAG